MVAASPGRKPIFRPEPFLAAPVSGHGRQRWQLPQANKMPALDQLKKGLPSELLHQLDGWLQRYLRARGHGWLITPVDFLHWLFRQPELPPSQRAEVAHVLAIELIQQERQIRRDQLEQFYCWNRASLRRLRCGSFSPSDRVVANPLVIRLSWQEPDGNQEVQTMQEVQWLFFPAESRLVALRPKPGVLELLAPLARSGSEGITIGQWLEQLTPEQAARVLRLLPELFQLGLAAAVE